MAIHQKKFKINKVPPSNSSLLYHWIGSKQTFQKKFSKIRKQHSPHSSILSSASLHVFLAQRKPSSMSLPLPSSFLPPKHIYFFTTKKLAWLGMAWRDFYYFTRDVLYIYYSHYCLHHHYHPFLPFSSIDVTLEKRTRFHIVQ